MRPTSAIIALSVLAIVISIAQAEPSEPIRLFNGKDLTGLASCFKVEGTKIGDVFTVRDGVLHCKGKPGGYIRTEQKYTNYKLKLEWRFPAKAGNSGVLLRIQEPDIVWPKCIEAQLASTKAGHIIDMSGTKEGFVKKHESNEKPIGEWNTYEITFDGPDLELKVNGLVQSTAPGRFVAPGYIGLQSEGAEIEFRNIELTPLPDRPSTQPAKE